MARGGDAHDHETESPGGRPGGGRAGDASTEDAAADLSVPVRPTAKTGGLVRRVAAALVPRRRNLRGTVYLVLDHSTSMGDPGKMEQLRQGALRFFLEAVQRDYAVGAVAFAGAAELVTGAGLNAHRFWRKLHALRPYGRTAMASGLRLGLGRLRFRGGRKVLVLITDGVPDDRAATLDAARLARARGVTLIPIGTGEADHAFLASLTGRPELVRHVTPDRLAGAIAGAARGLDET